MSSSCDNIKQSTANIALNEQIKEESANNNLSKMIGGEELLTVFDEKAKDSQLHAEGDIINDKNVDSILNSLYGTKGKREIILTKIAGLINQYGFLSEMNVIESYIITNQPKGVRSYDNKEFLKDGKTPNPNYGRFTLRGWSDVKLTKLYSRMVKTVNSVTGQTPHGLFGTFLGQLYTPRALSFSSYAFDMMARQVRDYASNVSYNINLFMTNPKEINPKFSLGMKDVISNVRKLGSKFRLETFQVTVFNKKTGKNETKTLNVDNPNIRMGNIFHRYMQGEIYIDPKTNQLMIYSDRVEMRDKSGKKMLWPDKSVRFTLSNPVPLKNYTPPNKKIGDWYVPFDKTDKKGKLIYKKAFNSFDKQTKYTRELNNAVFDYMVKEMKSSLNGILSELKTEFKNLNMADMRALLFRPDTKQAKLLFENLSKKQKEFLNMLKDTFSMHITDDFVIATGGNIQATDPEFKKNHFPAMYDINNFRFMLDEMIDGLESKITEFRAFEEAAIGAKKREWKRKADNLSGQLSNARHLIDSLDGMHYDLQHDLIIPLAKDNKYFKRISNAYDTRNTRTDEGVYYDYLKHIMSAIERNKLAATLVKSLKNAEDKDIFKAIKNIYKIPFSSTDIEGPFGTTIDGITRTINTIPGWVSKKMEKGKLQRSTVEELHKIAGALGIKEFSGMNKEALIKTILEVGKFDVVFTPEQVNREIKTWTSRLTGLYLAGLKTPVTNMSAMQQNLIDWGFEDTWNAWTLFRNEKDLDENGLSVKERIQRIIERSGITEFSDFFSKAMINNIVNKQLEEDIARYLMVEMLDYHKRIEDGTSEIESRKTFVKAAEKLLAKSSLFTKAEDLIILGEVRIKARTKDIKRKARHTRALKLVQYAITKKYELRQLVRPKFYNKVARKLLIPHGIKRWADFINGLGITMSNTEALLRSTTFTIGVNRHHESGQFENGRGPNGLEWYEFQTELDKARDTLLDLNTKLVEGEALTKKEQEQIPLLEEKIASLENDIQLVIKVGREFSYFSNFGLSTQDVGQFNWNGFGNLMGKFKYWSQQKFGRDVEIIRGGYELMKSLEHVNLERETGKPIFEGKAVAKTAGMFLKSLDPRYGKAIRTSHEEIAVLRNFFLIQGLTTAIWDTMISGPISMPGMKQIKGFLWTSGLGGQVRNITSDLLSLTFSPVSILLKSLFWDHFGDEEDLEMEATYYLRRTFLGILPMLTWDALMSLIYASTENKRKAKEKALNAVGPVTGGQLAPARWLRELMK